MSYQLTSNANRLLRTASVPSNVNISFCCWIILDTVVATSNIVGGLDISGQGNYVYLGTDGTGGRFVNYASGADAELIPTMSVGTPYFVAWTGAAAAGNVFGYASIAGAGALTVGTTLTNPTFTPTQLWCGGDDAGEYFRGQIYNLMIWSGGTPLTEPQLRAQRDSYVPLITANLWAHYPLVSDINDAATPITGQSRPLSVVTTLGSFTATPTGAPSPPAGANPTLVGVSAAIAVTATSAANITPAFPAGYTAVADDIAVILVHHSANGPFNTPTNYTIATDGIETLNDNNTVDQRVTVFWKRLVGGDTAQALVLTTNTVATVRGAILFIVRGCRTTGTPFEVCKRLLNAAAATISFPAVTTTLDNALLLALGAYEDDPSARTTPTNWTAGAVFTSALGNDMSLNYFTRVLAAAGTAIAFTTTVSTGTFANSVNVGAVLAFVPPLALPVFPSWEPLDAIPFRRSPVAVAF